MYILLRYKAVQSIFITIINLLLNETLRFDVFMFSWKLPRAGGHAIPECIACNIVSYFEMHLIMFILLHMHL